MFGWYTRFSHTYQASKSMTAPLLFRLAKPSAGFAAFSGADAGAEEPQVHSVKRPQWSEGKRPKPRQRFTAIAAGIRWRCGPSLSGSGWNNTWSPGILIHLDDLENLFKFDSVFSPALVMEEGSFYLNHSCVNKYVMMVIVMVQPLYAWYRIGHDNI